MSTTCLFDSLMRKGLKYLCFALLCSCTCEARSQSVLIAKERQALMPIVVNTTNMIPAEVTALNELIHYLKLVTGADFEVIEEGNLERNTVEYDAVKEVGRENNIPAIYLGPTRFAKKHQIDVLALAAEESVVQIAGNYVILAGGRPRGTLYAVYEFLENSLGCRWYTPWCEKMPELLNCAIPARSVKSRPYFNLRSHYTHLNDERIYSDQPAWTMFNLRNRLNEVKGSSLSEKTGGGLKMGGRIGVGHGLAPYLPAEKYFQDHPEYFSMRKGKRVPSNGLDGNHLCLTNPDVLRIITEGVLEDIQKDPAATCYTVAVNDGGCATICDCPKCRKIAEQFGASEKLQWLDAGLLLWFVNQVADGIKTKYPDKYIRTLAYTSTALPPRKIRARDNVIVQVCVAMSEQTWIPLGNNSFGMKQLEQWAGLAKHLWVWDYANNGRVRPVYTRMILWRMNEQMKFFKSLKSVDGVYQENELMMYEDSFFPQFYEMSMWVYAKLCQQPDLNLEALIADFLNGYYGKAGPSLIKYVKDLYASLPKYPYLMFDYDFMRRAQGYFEEAEKAVENNKELLARVKDLRIHLDLAALAWRNSIINDYLSKGNALDQYPFTIASVKERLIRTLNASSHPYVGAMAARGDLPGRQNREPVRAIALQYVEAVSAGTASTPLPKEIISLKPKTVIDLTAPLLAGSFFPMFVSDPQATLGLAVPIISSNEIPFMIGIYNLDGSGLGVDKNINRSDIPGEGYHLYRGPRFSMNEWTLSYLTGRWCLQKHFPALYDPKHPDKQWDIYASIKFAGPAYPYGEAGEPDAVYVDRILLVSDPTSEKSKPARKQKPVP